MSSPWERQLRLCYEAAGKDSTDPSTQNSALIISNPDATQGIMAANHFPLGVAENPQRWERPVKYYYVEHAERNAIYQAARVGYRTEGAIMVSPWAACADCARAIIQSGIKTLVRHRMKEAHAHWNETIIAGDTMMYEAGISIIELEPIPGYKLRRDGVLVDTGTL